MFAGGGDDEDTAGPAQPDVAALVYLIARFDLIWRTHDLFNIGFEKLRRFYGGMLAWTLEHRLATAGASRE